jgi:hypothetical protein
MKLVVATSSWNTVKLLESFLRHARRLGMAAAYVMDFDSTDGSAELLRAPEWRDFVRPVPFPGLTAESTSDILMEHAKQGHPDAFCLFCDPDEFLCTHMGSLQSVIREERWADHGVVQLRRFNMTASTSAIPLLQGPDFLSRMALSIRRARTRTHEELLGWELASPWIFSAVPAKVAVRLSDCTSIWPGDHGAVTTTGSILRSSRAWMQHYPIRSWAEFEEKVKNIAIHMESGSDDAEPEPEYGPYHCWHWHRWVSLLDSGGLRAEYERQFVDDSRVRQYLSDGILAYSDHLRHVESCDASDGEVERHEAAHAAAGGATSHSSRNRRNTEASIA